MRIRLFVSSTAVFLVAWLAVTYVRQVPRQGYPVLGKGGVPISAKVEAPEPEEVVDLGEEKEPLAVVGR